jgi:uncharacterized damage-inducible protein DinB
MVRVETVLESWRTIRQDTAQAVAEMPEEEMSFRPLPEMLTFQETARHILEAGHIVTGLLLDGETELTGPAYRASFPKYVATLPDVSTRDRLAAALRAEADERIAQLKEQAPEFFSGIVKRFDGQAVTRLEFLQWLKEHELSHRAQLFMYQRLKGIVPVTTRRRQAQQATR